MPSTTTMMLFGVVAYVAYAAFKLETGKVTAGYNQAEKRKKDQEEAAEREKERRSDTHITSVTMERHRMADEKGLTTFTTRNNAGETQTLLFETLYDLGEDGRWYEDYGTVDAN